MTQKQQHIVPVDGEWGIKKGGSNRLTEVFDKKEDAVDAGREIARNQGAEFFIHDRHGIIKERESYGNDPFPPRDTEH